MRELSGLDLKVDCGGTKAYYANIVQAAVKKVGGGQMEELRVNGKMHQRLQCLDEQQPTMEERFSQDGRFLNHRLHVR